MKKFIMVTPLQPVEFSEAGEVVKDLLRFNRYEAIGNSRLEFGKETRFPLIPLVNGYTKTGEKIRVIALTPDTDSARYHVKQLEEELSALQNERGFECDGVEVVPVTYAGDVDTQIEIFHKLMGLMEDNDVLHACLTYGNKPMPIAELMAIQYAYRVLKNVSIDCLVYGEVDHSKPDNPMCIFDITALVQLDELVRVLAEHKVADPKRIIDSIIEARFNDE